MNVIIQPFGGQSLGEVLKKALNGDFGQFHTFQAAVAFAKKTGVRHIGNELQEFVQQGGKARIVVGIDHHGTSQEGLEGLLTAVGEQAEVWINHTQENYITFHPKVYLFEGNEEALLIIGSGNLTEGGLYTNDEASSAQCLSLANDTDKELLDELNAYFDAWCDEDSGNARKLDQPFLNELLKVGYVLPETAILNEGQVEAATTSEQTQPIVGDEDSEQADKIVLFGKTAIKRFAPKYKKAAAPRSTKLRPTKPTQKTAFPDEQLGDKVEEDIEPRGFLMTLQKTDVGTGQTTPGTSRRSPEIFIPLTARNQFPSFWGWQDKFIEDPERPGKFDRFDVRMRIGGETVSVNIMYWPIKHDFRLRSEALRSAGNIGDILRIEQTDESQKFLYYVEIIPVGTSAYNDYLELCTNKTPNSDRVWGYYF